MKNYFYVALKARYPRDDRDELWDEAGSMGRLVLDIGVSVDEAKEMVSCDKKDDLAESELENCRENCLMKMDEKVRNHLIKKCKRRSSGFVVDFVKILFRFFRD